MFHTPESGRALFLALTLLTGGRQGELAEVLAQRLLSAIAGQAPDPAPAQGLVWWQHGWRPARRLWQFVMVCSPPNLPNNCWPAAASAEEHDKHGSGFAVLGYVKSLGKPTEELIIPLDRV